MKHVGHIIWRSKHEITHVLLGLLWVWYLGSFWGQWERSWFLLAAIGGLLPDIEHIYYFLTYGKTDRYSQSVVALFKNRQWLDLVTLLQRGHKKNTHLMLHNYFTTIFLLVCLWFALFIEARVLIVLFGALLSHFLFDIAEDIILLKRINPNWRRWGRARA